MKPLTLYIMKSDDGVVHPDSIMSFGDVIEETVYVKDRKLDKTVKGCSTDWFCYIFSNEYIEKELRDALPLYFYQDVYDIIVFMQKAIRGNNIKFYQSPRLFRRNIKLKGMLPCQKNLPHIRALDGFLVI